MRFPARFFFGRSMLNWVSQYRSTCGFTSSISLTSLIER